MYRVIVTHETRSLIKTPALLWMLLLLAVAIAFGAWSASNVFGRTGTGAAAMAQAGETMRARMRANVEKYEEKVKAAGGTMESAVSSHDEGEGAPQATNAGSMGRELGGLAILPPSGLAALSVGQSDIQLSYVPVALRNFEQVTRNTELENPVNLKKGTFDVAFVVIFLMPIFILAMSYDLLSSEKERGTLAMVLVHPITLGKLMTSKLIARAAIMLAVVLAFGCGALLVAGTGLDRIDTWIRFATWIGGTLLYCVFWFGLAVLVNALGRNSATNGIILAASWLMLVVVIPTLVSLVATALYPAPSRFDFITAARSAQTQSEARYMQALDKYYYDHLEFVPDGKDKVNDFLAVTIAKEAAVDAAVKPLYEQFRMQLANQERAVAAFQYLSPAIMMQRSMSEIAGTSSSRYADFVEQMRAFHARWTEFFTTRFLKRQPLTTADYANFPSFQYVEEPFAKVAWRLLPSITGLLVAVAVVLAAAFRVLRRYQVAA